MNRIPFRLACCALLLSALPFGLARGDTITYRTDVGELNTFDSGEGLVSFPNSGGWSKTGSSYTKGFPGYGAGYSQSPSGTITDTRGFLAFDLNGLPADINSAVLNIPRGTYRSLAPSETVELDDVTPSNVVPIVSSTLNLSGSYYTDLGSGNSYGQFQVTPGDPNDVLHFVLNAQAIADLGASSGEWFGIGLRLINPTGQTVGDSTQFEGVLNSTDVVTLTITTPEPSTIALAALGGAALFAFRRRRSKLR